MISFWGFLKFLKSSGQLKFCSYKFLCLVLVHFHLFLWPIFITNGQFWAIFVFICSFYFHIQSVFILIFTSCGIVAAVSLPACSEILQEEEIGTGRPFWPPLIFWFLLSCLLVYPALLDIKLEAQTKFDERYLVDAGQIMIRLLLLVSHCPPLGSTLLHHLLCLLSNLSVSLSVVSAALTFGMESPADFSSSRYFDTK